MRRRANGSKISRLDRIIRPQVLKGVVLAKRDREHGVLAEEDLHLAAMLAEIHRRDRHADEHIPALCVVEHNEFSRFWRAIENTVPPVREAAE